MHKPEWLSVGVERLLQGGKGTAGDPYDVLIVGSGYGGAVAAARLAGCVDSDGKGIGVCVLERGREHLPGTFPDRFSELPGHVRYSRFDDPRPKGVSEGVFDFRIGADVTLLVANGLGGGSLINAGLVAFPHDAVFESGWPKGLAKAALEARLEDLRAELGAVEAPTRDCGGTPLGKHERFVRMAGGGPATITVDADECVRCGDCATGCNVGAKRTLSSTYLFAAREAGAEIFTGATVSHLEKRSGRWVVFVAPTVPERPLRKDKDTLREVHARTVILSAGSLGSPEILMRSQARSSELRFSDALGRRFSTNGDMIAALYRKGERVRAGAEEHEALRARNVGPTITGIAHKVEGQRIVVEELAIPGALRRVFEEVVTTSAMLARLGTRDKDPHVAGGDLDPAAVDPALIDGCQVLAAMGDDGAAGKLELVPGWDDASRPGAARDGAIRVHWPEAGKLEVYKAQDKLFRTMAGEEWTYLPSPLWQPIPAGLSGALAGNKPTGVVFSVHPLGGCPMGDDISAGVVDHAGKVFAPDTGTGFHEGLLVLDGSIVPKALGVNPLLTITALADRAVEIYRRERSWRKAAKEIRPVKPPVPVERPRPAAGGTAFRFAERMSGSLRYPGADGSVQTELTLRFDRIGDLGGFLRQPHLPRGVSGTLRIRERGEDGELPAAVAVKGSVELLMRAPTGPVRRTLRALWVYLRTRAVPDLIGRLHEKRHAAGEPRSIGEKLRGAWNFLASYLALASHVGEVRNLFYSFTLEDDLRDAGGTVRLARGSILKGRKTLKYEAHANPWRQLVDLEVSAHEKEGGKRIGELGTLSVDPAYFFNGFESRLRFASQRDLPAAWMDLASLGLFLGRILLKIHFWSFRLPEYQKYDPARDLRRIPGRLKGLLTERHMVGYPETPRDAGIFLPVTRYRKAEKCPQGPVVLFHGLGSGGIQFSTPRVSPNMAQYLADHGFDVWVAELRTSIALPYSLDQWTIDEVARGDIPRIIDFVLGRTGAEQTNVVAHCIGSAMFCTAVLDGRLQHSSGRSKVRSAALLQVGPLITLSKGTRLRGLAVAPLRRFFPEGHVDFSVDDRAAWVEAMIDRLLTTYPYPPEEARHHRLRWSWRHNSHIANCNRWAAIDGRMFRHENLTEEMLDNLGEVLGHSSLTTWAQTIQYAFLERLTDSNARNSYVTTENVRDFFTFPVRFIHGAENDVFDPLTSHRSAELLQRVHGPGAAEVCIVDKYGHFDPLIGKNAVHDVFLHVAGFLEQRHEQRRPRTPPRDETRHFYVRRPLIGPVIGWTRWEEKEGAWVARIWCRIDDLRSPATGIIVRSKPKGGADESARIVPPPAAGPMDTLLCLDVALGSEGGEYEVTVLSLHEGEEPAAGMREAEAAAGKRLSRERAPLTVSNASTLDQQVMQAGKVDELRSEAEGSPDDPGFDDKICAAAVTVPDAKEQGEVAFALGSCRYPGWLFDRRLADHTFGALRRHLDERKLAALFLIGDQIYADATAGAFDPKDARERFQEAYREAWTAPNARDVLSRVPVYMMMDDHEAGNDWHPDDVMDEEGKTMREHGLQTFQRYQWSHSPQWHGRLRPPAGTRTSYYYLLDLHGFPFFVCDTRSGRSGHGVLDDAQLGALIDWLRKARRDRPKFIVSPSVVMPFLADAADYPGRSDGWDRDRRQLEAVLYTICAEDIGDVVFLCGDSHFALEAGISFLRDGKPVGPAASCIMASPMYAPYPFANGKPEQYLASADVQLRDGTVARYKVARCYEGASVTTVGVSRQSGTWRVRADVLPARAPCTDRLAGAVSARTGRPPASDRLPATSGAAARTRWKG